MKKTNNNNIKEKYITSENYQKHFDLDARIKIQKIITEHRDESGAVTIFLKDIGKILQNDPSTISKEVKNHRKFKARREYYDYRLLNSICANYADCKIKSSAYSHKNSFLKTCSDCINSCKEYKEFICPYLKKFPWVCNGCPNERKCRLNKFYYYADVANRNYKKTLSEAREGINLTEEEFDELNHLMNELVGEKKQPIAHIVRSNDLPVSERTIYTYVENGYFDIKNVDLRRKVTYKKRKSTRTPAHVVRKIRQGRTYDDYQKFISVHSSISIVEMDTVEGKQGENGYLLTLHFIKYEFQLSFFILEQKSEYVKNVFNHIQDEIGIDNFKNLFGVILTDNGKEFSDPESIEMDPTTGKKRTQIFFCNPSASYQKGSCEKNHEYIRYVVPKGTSLKNFNQEKADLMMSHINSTIRPSMNACPYDFMALAFGTEIIDKFKIKKIDPKLVTLDPKLVK